MSTDPARVRKTDPGNPDVCRVCQYYKYFNESECDEVVSGCRAGTSGCVECKTRLAETVNQILDPFRENYAILTRDSKIVKKVVQEGLYRAQLEAETTMTDVRKAMNF